MSGIFKQKQSKKSWQSYNAFTSKQWLKIRIFSEIFYNELYFGPALKQLRTDKRVFLKNFYSKYELGIIAGKYDEKVPVENTKLKI